MYNLRIDKIKPVDLLYFLSAIFVFTSRFNGVNVNNYARYFVCLCWLIYLCIKLYKMSPVNQLAYQCSYHMFYMMLPYLVMAGYTLILWCFEMNDVIFRNYTRLASTLLYLFLAFSFISVGYLLFQKKVIDVLFWSTIISYSLGSILSGIFELGFLNIFRYFLSIFTNSEAADINYFFEIHDITFSMGIFFIYYLFFEKSHKHKYIKLFILLIFLILGFKRIQLIAILLCIVAYFSLFKICRKLKTLRLSAFIIAGVVVFFYVFSVKSGLLSRIATNLDIETSGRLEYYSFAAQYYEFSFGYFGRGFTWFSRMFQKLYEAGFRLNGHRVAASIHSDVLVLYIEIGIWGMIIWLYYSFCIKTKMLSKRYGGQVARCYLILMIYMLVLYLTDNPLMYLDTQMLFFAIPLAMSFRNECNLANELRCERVMIDNY